MNRTWEIWLCDPAGTRIKTLDEIINFSLVKVANNIGAFSITLPGNFDESLLKVDSLIEFWRNPDGWQLVGFIRKFLYTVDSSGADIIVIGGPDSNDLLIRRIIAYAANTAQSLKTDYADDMMKAIVRENLGSSASASRDLTSLNFTVAPDFGLASSITMGFPWKIVYDALKDITNANLSYYSERLYFDCVPQFVNNNQIGFEFRTYINQPGIDRTGTSQMVFGREWGNLENPQLEKNYSEEENYIYAGGGGDESDRTIVEVSDSTRMNMSIWNRREGFEDARSYFDVADISSIGYAAVTKGKPTTKFIGTLLDTPFSQYGIDWNWGDKVFLTYRGIQLTGIINNIMISVDSNGKEDIKATVDII